MKSLCALLTVAAAGLVAFGPAPDDGGLELSVGAPVQLNAVGTDVPPPRGGFSGQVVSRGGKLWAIYRSTRRDERGLEVFLATVSGEGVSDRVTLTEDAGEHVGPGLLLDAEGNLHASWLEVRGRRGAGSAVSYRRLEKNASAWSAVTRVPAGRNRTRPLLGTLPSGEVFLVFPSTEVRGGGSTGMRFLLSVDKGGSFQPIDVEFPNPIGFAAEPGFATGPEREVVLVWTDQTPGGVATVLNRSADGGRTWFDEPVVVSDDRTVRTSQPKVLYAGDRMVVLWLVKAGTQHHIWLDYSLDGGESWQGNRLILTREGDLFDWDVLNDGASLYLIWREGLRRGPIQREKVGVQLFTVEGPIREPFFPDLEGSARVIGFTGAVVEGRPLLSALTVGPDRAVRASMHVLDEGVDSIWRDILGGDSARTYYSLVPFSGGAALLYREGAARWLPQQNPWRADLLLRAVSVTRR